MKSSIYIRADGDAQIGLGHLVRCMALAYMLKEEFSISFVYKYAPESIIEEIEKAGFSLLKIKNEEDFLVILNSGGIVVLDHYGLDSDYQKEIKQKGCKLVCIDDLHDKEFFADLIINHAPGVKAMNYRSQPSTQFALGLDYVLLRPAFLEAAKQERKIKGLKTVFICFGGADYRNLTRQCVHQVVELNIFEKIIVVIGSAYQKKEELLKFTNNIPNLSIYHSINEGRIVDLMNISDVAIVPASGILLEVLSSGCRVISGKYVDNQRHLHSQYKSINAFIDADNFSEDNLKLALNTLISSTFKMPERFIDGLSSTRLLKLIKQLEIENEISLRKATYLDSKTTFHWAKDKRIRAHSFNQTEIKEQEHHLWFSDKINDDNCVYFIATIEDKSIGSIRFDIKENQAIISYLIDPLFHGQGFGVLLLRKGIEILTTLSEVTFNAITGYVMPENISSVKAFQKLGFDSELENNILKFTKKLK